MKLILILKDDYNIGTKKFTLSNKTEYPLKTILDLSYHHNPEETVQLTEISMLRNTPFKYLTQIMLT